MKLEITETEIFMEELSKKEYDAFNRVASKHAHELHATRETQKEKRNGFWFYTSSYESELHRGYCFQVAIPGYGGRNIHAHDEFFLPIKNELIKLGYIKK